MGPGGPSFGGATIRLRNAGYWIIVAITLTTVAVVSLIRTPAPSSTTSSASTPTVAAGPEAWVPIGPQDFGNGVVYFPVSGDQYVRSLSEFYADNPGKHCDYQGSTERVEQIRGRWDTIHTITTGHILHCHDLAIDAQDLTKE